MSNAAYAAAKNAERATAAKLAVAEGLETISTAIERQDAAITKIGEVADREIGVALKTASAAHVASTDALSRATEANARLADFTGMTFWPRLRWIVTGRVS